MIRAKNFMAGNAMMRQLAFSKLDLVMHRTLAQDLPQDLESSLQNILRDYLTQTKDATSDYCACVSVTYLEAPWATPLLTTPTNGRKF